MRNQTAIYARYSPKPKKKSGGEDRHESIEVQLDHCRAYCERSGLLVVDELLEPGVSGYKSRIGEREAGRQLLAGVAAKKYRHVVVMRLDRLSRRTSDVLAVVEDWVERGVTLHLASQGGCSINASTPEGMLFITMLAGFSQFERQLISTRTSQAMSRNAQQTQSGSCRIPWGRQRGEGAALVECADELQVAVRIKALHAEGLSLRDIGRALEADGILCRGKAWHPSTISGILG